MMHESKIKNSKSLGLCTFSLNMDMMNVAFLKDINMRKLVSHLFMNDNKVILAFIYANYFLGREVQEGGHICIPMADSC